ncbi:MAG: class I SAM-dependent methyltransferase [Lachnospiraceae bacterium]|nr:class I SAM-dependent methyltransferase [Lachnospiraceae bacterium]
MEQFQDYAYYYNAFYKDKDYKKETEMIEMLLKKWGDFPQNCILNLGCGTGRHDVEFAKMGYCVTGVDLSPQMIDIANRNNKQKGLMIEYEVADIRNYVTSKSYDVVTALFHVMSYQNSNEDIINAFLTAANAIRENGIFIFDLWYGPGVLSDKPTVRFKTVHDEKYTLHRVAVPAVHIEENVVDVNYCIFVIENETGYTRLVEEVHKMRYFFIPELKIYLQQAGFELLECLDSNTLQKTNFNSWTAICVAKKSKRI